MYRSYRDLQPTIFGTYIDNNLYYQPGNTNILLYGITIGENTITADTFFVDADNGDFRLLPEALTIGDDVATAAVQEFKDLYNGLDISSIFRGDVGANVENVSILLQAHIALAQHKAELANLDAKYAEKDHSIHEFHNNDWFKGDLYMTRIYYSLLLVLSINIAVEAKESQQ